MKKNTGLFLFIIISTIFLNGCSWVEYFVVKNNTESAISISYQLDELKNGVFNIFDHTPTAYQLNKKGTTNWDKKLIVTDNDTSLYSIRLTLPPKSMLIFGRLNNDNYTSKDQYFINGRSFNFSMMEIEKPNELIRITATTFDDFFKKEKGEIKYEIK